PKKSFTDTNANSFSDKVLRWELLEAKLAPLLDTMPHVKPVHDQLVQLITTAKSHEFELKGMRANAKQGAADRKAMIRAGDGIRSRLASALAFEHGPTSAALAEFGIRPRKSGGRKKKAGPPPSPIPTPHPAPEATPAPAGAGVGTVK
ncbi:MAG: hypothetical protein QOJ16_3908, partial [Acidobacteriota bacterium]|nr:hypothetical protein [Acidobacteriota bacterium]